MSGPNAFERLHEAWIRSTEIALSPDDVDLLFDLLHDEILDANVHHLQSGRRLKRRRARLQPGPHYRPDEFIGAAEIAESHGVDYELFRTALEAADLPWHQDGESWTAGKGSPPHRDMLDVLEQLPANLTTLKHD
ncbi:MAG: hypothetical protein OXP75_10685 [Rhodospirillales bacterium]|nr:hypothetical protein [Rhodospirillales bacterium]